MKETAKKFTGLKSKLVKLKGKEWASQRQLSEETAALEAKNKENVYVVGGMQFSFCVL